MTFGGVPSDMSICFEAANTGYINVPYSSTLSTSQFTVEGWLNITNFPFGSDANMTPLSFDYHPNPPEDGWSLDIQDPDTDHALLVPSMANGTSSTQPSDGTPIQGQWFYFAMTYNGTDFCTYTNGVLVTTTAAGYSPVTNDDGPLYLGCDNSFGPAHFYVTRCVTRSRRCRAPAFCGR